MNISEVEDKLMLYFRNNVLYNESPNELDRDESLIDGGYIDSTGIIGLVAYIEKNIGIKVHDHEIVPENFDTVNNIYSYIERKLERKGCREKESDSIAIL